MEVSIELYKVFYHIVKEGNITKAAEKLFVSQSAVTQSLKKLEEQLGGTLFVRSKSGVKLTDEGKKLFDYIEESINTLGNAGNVFSQYLNNEVGTIRVSCGSAIGKIIISSVIKEFYEKYPKIKIEFGNNKTNENIDKVLKDEVDIAFIEAGDNLDDRIDIIPLTKCNFCFFTTPNYLKKIGKFDINKLKEYNFILPIEGTRRQMVLAKKLKEKGIEIEPEYTFSSANMLEIVVENDLGIGYINEFVIKDKLKKGSLVKIDLGIENMESQIVAVIKNKKTASNASLILIDMIKKKFENLKD